MGLKAYEVIENSTGYYIIVFAESASKAKYTAYNNREDFGFDDYCYDFFSNFIRLFSVKRDKSADKEYRGHSVMDWNNPEDRLFLVKEHNWACVDETDLDCDNCPAKKFCRRYSEYLEEQEYQKIVEDELRVNF